MIASFFRIKYYDDINDCIERKLYCIFAKSSELDLLYIFFILPHLNKYHALVKCAC